MHRLGFAERHGSHTNVNDAVQTFAAKLWLHVGPAAP